MNLPFCLEVGDKKPVGHNTKKGLTSFTAKRVLWILLQEHLLLLISDFARPYKTGPLGPSE